MSDKLSRRSFLAGGAAAMSSMAAGLNGAAAETDQISNFLQGDNLAEWSDGFDSLSPAKKIRNFQPTLLIITTPMVLPAWHRPPMKHSR